MYNLLDRPVSILPEGSRFLLWAMRAWVTVRRKGACPPAGLAPAFLKMSAIDALPHFHIVMSTLSCDAREELDFHCLHNHTINETEAVLLRLWSDMAAGDECAAIAVIEMLLKDEAVTAFFSATRAALHGLSGAGLTPLVPAFPQSIAGGQA